MPKRKNKYTHVEVLTELEEIVNPVFRNHGRRGKYYELITKVQKFPDRWFVVTRFAYEKAPEHGSYAFLKPYLLSSRLNKRHGAEGFVFKTLREDDSRFPKAALVRTVLVKYSSTPKKRAVATKKTQTKKAGAK